MRFRFLSFLFWLAAIGLRLWESFIFPFSAILRFLSAVYYLPIVEYDRRVAEVNLLRLRAQATITEANLNAARIGQIFATHGSPSIREDAQRCFTAVSNSVMPKPNVPVPLNKASK